LIRSGEIELPISYESFVAEVGKLRFLLRSLQQVLSMAASYADRLNEATTGRGQLEADKGKLGEWASWITSKKDWKES
jgi:hypothetical protein